MAQYRKKPVVIEAIQINSQTEQEISIWSSGAVYPSPSLPGEYWLVKTLEGVMTANPGDYIIKGVKGEFYPCKPDIFEETYEKLN